MSTVHAIIGALTHPDAEQLVVAIAAVFMTFVALLAIVTLIAMAS